jgi:hypothetical protein
VIIRRSTLLDVSAARAWKAVLQPRLLDYVAYPLQVFEPLDPPRLPEFWTDGAYKVQLRLFGIVPMGVQWIVIQIVESGPDWYRLRDNGYGNLVRRWDHLITIEPLSSGKCRYTDEVDVRAGLLTPYVVTFAWFFYRHRQHRWRQLVESNFDPLAPAGGG